MRKQPEGENDPTVHWVLFYMLLKSVGSFKLAATSYGKAPGTNLENLHKTLSVES